MKLTEAKLKKLIVESVEEEMLADLFSKDAQNAASAVELWASLNEKQVSFVDEVEIPGYKRPPKPGLRVGLPTSGDLYAFQDWLESMGYTYNQDGLEEKQYRVEYRTDNVLIRL